MIYMLGAILVFGVVLYKDVLSDYSKWKKDISINHKIEWLYRAALLSPALILLSLPRITFLEIVASGIMVAALWWELFDGFYNKIRGFSWRFNGSDDNYDSFFDDFLRDFSPKQQAMIKWSLILISIIIYICIYQNK